MIPLAASPTAEGVFGITLINRLWPAHSWMRVISSIRYVELENQELNTILNNRNTNAFIKNKKIIKVPRSMKQRAQMTLNNERKKECVLKTRSISVETFETIKKTKPKTRNWFINTALLFIWVYSSKLFCKPETVETGC